MCLVRFCSQLSQVVVPGGRERLHQDAWAARPPGTQDLRQKRHFTLEGPRVVAENRTRSPIGQWEEERLWPHSQALTTLQGHQRAHRWYTALFSYWISGQWNNKISEWIHGWLSYPKVFVWDLFPGSRATVPWWETSSVKSHNNHHEGACR